MKQKLKNDEIRPKFDWVGLLALLIGLELPLLALGYLFMMPIPSVVLKGMVYLAPIILIIFVRYYTWKNIFLALLLIISTLHPIRFLSRWWLNPLLYTLLALVCLFLLRSTIRHYNWKNALATLLIICTLLSGWQILVSTVEVGNCVIEDKRWTDYYICHIGGNWYQQIQSSPIGMKGWCYYCPWYGVEW